MSPVKGRDVDQAELRLRLSAFARRGAHPADRRHRAGRRRPRSARPATPSVSTASSASSSRMPARTRRPRSPCCAVGGYGRKSQFLHSDIDLLVLFGGPIGRPEERFVKSLLHPLWDLRFQVGHHVRELGDFDHLDTTNPEYLLALMDLRPLAGDRELTDRLECGHEIVDAASGVRRFSTRSSRSPISATASSTTPFISSSRTSRTAPARCATSGRHA